MLCHLAKSTKIALDACWVAKWGMFFYPRPEEIAERMVSGRSGSSYYELVQMIKD
jgi:hypothetical protein